MTISDLSLTSDKPKYIQIYEYFLSEIRLGNLSKHSRLPSKRTLSKTLGVSQNTVDLAYQLLVSKGYAYSIVRSGIYVSDIGSDAAESIGIDWRDGPSMKYVLTCNNIDSSATNLTVLSRIAREIIADRPELLCHGEKDGERDLRMAISRHLNQTQGIKCTPDRIIIGTSKDYLINALMKLFPSDTVYGIENPHNHRPCHTFTDMGRTLRTINISLDGIDPDDLISSDIDVMYFMPSHHIPTGYIMSQDQRNGVLKWLEESENRYIIEDGESSELIYNSEALPPLIKTDKTNRVFYLGDFSRSIGESVKLAYIILPRDLLDKWRTVHQFYTSNSSRFEQAILAEYIDKGFYQKSAKSLCKACFEKQSVLLDALSKLPFADKLDITGKGAGTHFSVCVNLPMNETELRKSAAKIGVKLVTLHAFMSVLSDKIPDKSFVFGYGGLTTDEIKSAVELLGRAWSDDE